MIQERLFPLEEPIADTIEEWLREDWGKVLDWMKANAPRRNPPASMFRSMKDCYYLKGVLVKLFRYGQHKQLSWDLWAGKARSNIM